MASMVPDDVQSLPYLFQSEEAIAEEAPLALAYLRRTKNIDVAPILGLEYMEESFR